MSNDDILDEVCQKAYGRPSDDCSLAETVAAVRRL